MIEVALQLKSYESLSPASSEDAERLKAYRPDQIVKAKIQGFKKPRSYQQLKLYWGCCKTVADNTEDPMWNQKEKVDFQCRVACHFVDPTLIVVKPDGTVQFSYRSIAFVNLGHIEACGYFDQAFKVMAKKLGISVDKLLENANG